MSPTAENKKTKQAPRASWTAERDKIIIDALLDQAKQGKRADSGFKKEAWVAVEKELQNKTKLAFTKQQIKSRIALVNARVSIMIAANNVFQLKSSYRVFKALKDNSGFGWDDAKKIPTAPDEVWDEYLEVFTSYILFSCTLYLSMFSSLFYRNIRRPRSIEEKHYRSMKSFTNFSTR